MYILIGSTGMLGSDVKAALEENNIDFKAYDYPEIDITNQESVNSIITPECDVVINCSAYTAVDQAESDIDRCRAINATGVKYLAEACQKNDVKLVHISTDFVFDGEKPTPYNEDDKPNATSIYGITKQEGEAFIEEIMDKYFILRTAYLFGINGNNFIETMIRLKDNDVLKVINDQKGSPTHSKDLAQAILAVAASDDYGIYHATSEGEATWYELAKYVFDQLNLETNLTPCTTADYPTPASRPANSVLENNHFKANKLFTFPDWHQAVDEYLELRNEQSN